MEVSFGSITFSSKFDSGNLACVEQIADPSNLKDDNTDFVAEPPDFEFNLWTSPDAAGTPYENGNRTWFYFSIRGPLASKAVRMNIMNLNRQSRLYGQGLCPFFRTSCGKNSTWQRIKSKVCFGNEGKDFRISFIHRFTEVTKLSTTYFAFCHPYSYIDCQQYLDHLEDIYTEKEDLSLYDDSDIYLHRDTLIYSNDGLKIDLLTVSSRMGVTEKRETTLLGLYPDKTYQRSKIFREKKVVFVTSRVHPGETPASFVFKGFLDFLLRANDKRSAALRDLYVFKLIPMLNPDGVKRGHYRTDIFGVNLNRTYKDPDVFRQPSIFAVKTLMMYHHFNRVDPNICTKDFESGSQQDIPPNNNNNFLTRKSKTGFCLPDIVARQHDNSEGELFSSCETINDGCEKDKNTPSVTSTTRSCPKSKDYDGFSKQEQKFLDSTNVDVEEEIQSTVTDGGGVFIYVDLHGHASKRGCFIYGNHFTKDTDMVECMLFPKLISLNSSHFDFQACNFTVKNMYHMDKKDGLSKEGSGRVSMFKALGIIHSYTLECNYNTGRSTNPISPATCDDGRATPPPLPGFPPRYTQEHFEEVGRGTAIAMLDIANCNPWSRLPTSEYKTLNGVRDWLTKFLRNNTKVIVPKNNLKKKNALGKSILCNQLMKETIPSQTTKTTLFSPSIHDAFKTRTKITSTSAGGGVDSKHTAEQKAASTSSGKSQSQHQRGRKKSTEGITAPSKKKEVASKTKKENKTTGQASQRPSSIADLAELEKMAEQALTFKTQTVLAKTTQRKVKTIKPSATIYPNRNIVFVKTPSKTFSPDKQDGSLLQVYGNDARKSSSK